MFSVYLFHAWAEQWITVMYNSLAKQYLPMPRWTVRPNKQFDCELLSQIYGHMLEIKAV